MTHGAWTVARLELRRLRVDGTWAWVLLGAWLLALLPLWLGAATSSFEATARGEHDDEVYRIAAPPELQAAITAAGHTWVRSDAVAWEARIRLEPERVVIDWSSDEPMSDRASDRAEELVEEWQRGRIAATASDLGLPAPPHELVQDTVIDRSDEAVRRLAAAASQTFLLLLVALSIPATYVAADTFAGDKERGTLEVLLVTRTSREAIVRGKALAVGTMATLGGWGVLGLAAALTVFDKVPELADLPNPGLMLAWAGLTTPVLAALTTAIVVAAFSRVGSYRAASLASLPVVLGVFALGSAGMVPGLAAGATTALLPIANLALAWRDAMLGHATVGELALTLGGAGLHVVLATLIARKALEGDEALLNTDQVAARRARGDHRRDAVMLALIVISAQWLFGGAAQSAHFVVGLLSSQVIGFALLAVLAVRSLGLPVRETLSLRRPSLQEVGLGGLIGIGLVGVTTLVLQLQEPWLPVSPELQERMLDLLLGDRPLWAALLLVALLPAVCEELFFRGAVLGMFRGHGSAKVAIGINAALFGLVHFDLARIVPTGVVGLFLAMVVWRSGSLWVGSVTHGVYNAVLISGAWWVREGGDVEWLEGVAGVLGSGVLAGVAVVGVGALRSREDR